MTIRCDTPVLSTPAAAKYLGISQSLLKRDRRTGRLGIPYARLGDRIVYITADLLAWLGRQVVVPVSQGQQIAKQAREPAASGDLPRSGRPTRAEQAAAHGAGFPTVAAYRQHQRQSSAAHGGAA